MQAQVAFMEQIKIIPLLKKTPQIIQFNHMLLQKDLMKLWLIHSALYNLPTTGLRFFTAYGPWGRPDQALFIFTKNILKKKNKFI